MGKSKNSSKHPQGYKHQTSLDEAKQKISGAQSKRGTGQATIKPAKQRYRAPWCKSKGPQSNAKMNFHAVQLLSKKSKKLPKDKVATTSVLLTSGN